MSEPKVLVLSVQPTYAMCMVNGKSHVERFTVPATKEEVKTRIVARLKKTAEQAEPANEPAADRTTPEADSKRKPKG